MLCNSYNPKILYEEFHWIYLRGDIKLLVITVNDRLILEIEIVHDLSCHPIQIVSALFACKSCAFHNWCFVICARNDELSMSGKYELGRVMRYVEQQCSNSNCDGNSSVHDLKQINVNQFALFGFTLQSVITFYINDLWFSRRRLLIGNLSCCFEGKWLTGFLLVLP